jgi:hypothetical protein
MPSVGKDLVRIEGVSASNPATSTTKLQVASLERLADATTGSGDIVLPRVGTELTVAAFADL